MGAVIGMFGLIAIGFVIVGVIYAAWATVTLVKYALYRTLSVGTMPIGEYFKYYFEQVRI